MDNVYDITKISELFELMTNHEERIRAIEDMLIEMKKHDTLEEEQK